MPLEIREGGVTVGGKPQTVRGAMLNVGDKAPDFELIANNFSVKSLADYEGKVKLLSVVPSLDTRLCDAQTRRFNEEASDLGDDVVVLTISADLPFAQRRWCGNADVDRVETLSTHKDMKFSDDYGVHHLESRTNQRAIFVVDKDNTLKYAEYVPEIGQPVDFDKALEAVRDLV